MDGEDDAPAYLSARKRVRHSGDVTLRPAAPWTTSVHAWLKHLEAVGFAGSPRIVGTGVDAEGWETLQFVVGQATATRVWSEEGIYELGQLLRRLHQATATFRAPSHAVWQESFLRSAGVGAIISHGDVAPWNVVVREDRPVAFIDWELAGPVEPLDEVAHTGWLNARLFDDGVDAIAGLPSAEQRTRHLRCFVDGYELPAQERAELSQRLIEVAVLSAAADAVEANITPESTDEMRMAWGVAWRARSAAWLVRHRRLFERALR
jgi:Ser/Thr protein kinase RdoA (MazF antagonist)